MEVLLALDLLLNLLSELLLDMLLGLLLKLLLELLLELLPELLLELPLELLLELFIGCCFVRFDPPFRPAGNSTILSVQETYFLIDLDQYVSDRALTG